MDIDNIKITELNVDTNRNFMARSEVENFLMHFSIDPAGKALLNTFCGKGLTLQEIRKITSRCCMQAVEHGHLMLDFNENFFQSWSESNISSQIKQQLPAELKAQIQDIFRIRECSIKGHWLGAVEQVQEKHYANCSLPFTGIPYLFYANSGELYGLCQFNMPDIRTGCNMVSIWNRSHLRDKLYLLRDGKILMTGIIDINNGRIDTCQLTTFFNKAEKRYGKLCHDAQHG